MSPPGIGSFDANAPFFSAGSRLLEMVLGELGADLSDQLADGIAMPALIGVDSAGERQSKDLAPIDTQGQPISDFVLAQVLERHARPGVAAMGHVRVDCSEPRIIAWCLRGPLAVTIDEICGFDPQEWPRSWSTKLGQEPRGGSEGLAITRLVEQVDPQVDPMLDALLRASGTSMN